MNFLIIKFIWSMEVIGDLAEWFQCSYFQHGTIVNDGWAIICICICNELGEAGAGCIPTRPASVDQVYTKNNRHTPVMVSDDLMIIKHTVLVYNTNRSRPVTI